jgi:hypothetical protein
MSHENGKIAILFNGPPRAGKDTAVNALVEGIVDNYEIIKFTGPVKDLTHLNYGLSCAQDAYETNKDTPLADFNGKTPRQAYIETSSNLKKMNGSDAVAKLFVEAIHASDAEIILNPDVGDDMEALAVANSLGLENVLVLRIHTDGHDFSKDCRTWVQSHELTIIDIVNENGKRREFETEVAARVRSFLERVSDIRSSYAA